MPGIHCKANLSLSLNMKAKNIIPYRYLAAILDLCKFDLFPTSRSVGTFYGVLTILRKCFVKIYSVAICSKKF